MLQLLRQYTPFVLLCLFATSAIAHGPVHEKIEEVSKEIEKHPSDPNLYVERAGYYKKDRDFDRSFADYQKARNLDGSLVTIDFLVAELFVEFDHYNSALASINAFQKLKTNIAQCYLLKAKIFDKLFESDSALYYAEAAYPHLTKPSTNYFVKVKDYTLFADKTDYERAQKWLVLGKKRMPYDLVIQEEYVKLALKFEDYQTAISLCQEKIGSLKRKEYWYYLHATALQEAGNTTEALSSLALASQSIDKLPRHHKNTSFIKSLKTQINKKETQLKS